MFTVSCSEKEWISKGTRLDHFKRHKDLLLLKSSFHLIKIRCKTWAAFSTKRLQFCFNFGPEFSKCSLYDWSYLSQFVWVFPTWVFVVRLFHCKVASDLKFYSKLFSFLRNKEWCRKFVKLSFIIQINHMHRGVYIWHLHQCTVIWSILRPTSRSCPSKHPDFSLSILLSYISSLSHTSVYPCTAPLRDLFIAQLLFIQPDNTLPFCFSRICPLLHSTVRIPIFTTFNVFNECQNGSKLSSITTYDTHYNSTWLKMTQKC